MLSCDCFLTLVGRSICPVKPEVPLHEIIALKRQFAGRDKLIESNLDCGEGLGLAICRTIIERHDGQLSAASDGRNGALFRIQLPISARPQPAAKAKRLALTRKRAPPGRLEV